MGNTTNQQKVIGLTGTYCAGKNYIGRLLEERGLPVLDVDKLGHRAIETEREAILKRFGEDILGTDGAIDRRLLGEKVFGKGENLAALEGIVHPAANRMTSEWIAAQRDEQEGKPCVINAALLHRSSAFPQLDCIILVQAPTLTRLLRARKRDGLSFGQILRRFGSQKKFTPQYFEKKADIYIIENRGYFGFCASLYRRRIDNRLNEILSRVGMA
ncbi:dephospho-CoA kinase [Treponema primitia]|uniref:dephospho-CoA kinase n=1 Tax=Treponema primitia TaxID=88058 RepID=UPI000255563F|nr:dephospho-CoA kinase [Treponema primitia]